MAARIAASAEARKARGGVVRSNLCDDCKVNDRMPGSNLCASCSP